MSFSEFVDLIKDITLATVPIIVLFLSHHWQTIMLRRDVTFRRVNRMRDAWANWLDEIDKTISHGRHASVFRDAIDKAPTSDLAEEFSSEHKDALKQSMSSEFPEQSTFQRAMLVDGDRSRKHEAQRIRMIYFDFICNFEHSSPDSEERWIAMEKKHATARSEFIDRLQVDFDNLESNLTR